MRALVTGGAGFIGSTLVDRLLAEGHPVDVVDDLSTGTLGNLADARGDRSHELKVHQVDIRSSEVVDLLVRRRPEVVFHLAAQTDVQQSLDRPAHDASINVVGSTNVLEGARAAGARKIVFASSGRAIYGVPTPSELPVRESQPQLPLSPHGVSKKAVGDLLGAYRALYGLEFVTLALADVYGPRQDPSGEAGLVADLADRLVCGEACTISGDGSQTRDLVFVDDVVDAFVRAADRGSGLLCNIGTGRETAVRDLHRVMATAVGRPDAEVVETPARPNAPARSALDPGRAKLHLGWTPWTELEAGAAAVLRWSVDRRAARR